MNQKTYITSNPVAVESWDQFDTHVSNICDLYKDHLILFRGQRNLYPTIRSGRCRPDVKIPRDLDRGWRSLAAKMLGNFSAAANGEQAKAILQHYGLPTHFVDLTADSRIAGWFASHELETVPHFHFGSSSLRQFSTSRYRPSGKSDGYILVLAIPDPNALISKDRLFDLSKLPRECARPHRQESWLLLDRPPTEPTPNSFWIATFKLNTETIVGSLKTLSLFPSATEDQAFAQLLSLPFVLCPLATSSKPELNSSEWCSARRVLDVPEYVDEPETFGTNHTWNDLTIYEPHHMRCWKQWQFDISQVYPELSGDIKDTIKVSLTPEAWGLLQKATDKRLQWPELGSDGVFFTFAALDHDKVVEHSPPYHGVWLQRDDELVVEMTMKADKDSLSVGNGHVYFLKGGGIERQSVKGSCGCGKPESHDHRVASVLRLSSCLDDGSLILLPHPQLDESVCYVVITGDEGATMQSDVDSFQEMHRKVLKGLSSHLNDDMS